MSNIFISNLPHTAEGSALALTKEQEEYCRVVYKLDDQGGAVFSGFWDPSEDYPDCFVIAPLRSTYKGLSEEYPIGTNFANVLGSTGDKPNNDPTKYWYDFIKEKLAAEGYCSSPCCAQNKLYDSSNDGEIKNVYIGTATSAVKFTCGGALAGGHVLMDVKTPAVVARNTDVCILPICANHNIAHITLSSGWGDRYYMKLERKMKAVVMEGYLPRHRINH